MLTRLFSRKISFVVVKIHFLNRKWLFGINNMNVSYAGSVVADQHYLTRKQVP